MESAYWPWRNSGKKLLLDGGSWWEQDALMMLDLYTFDALVEAIEEETRPKSEKNFDVPVKDEVVAEW